MYTLSGKILFSDTHSFSYFCFDSSVFMKRFFGLLALVALLAACDDGDVITSELIFEGDLTRCDSFVDEFLIYDLNKVRYLGQHSPH